MLNQLINLLWTILSFSVVGWYWGEFFTEKQANARQYLSKIALQERYHYSCFVFFTLSAFSALVGGKIQMALLISIANVIYNVYPILLQQYNRLRIKRLLNLPVDV